MGLQLEASDNLLRLRLDEQEGLSLEVAVGELAPLGHHRQVVLSGRRLVDLPQAVVAPRGSRLDASLLAVAVAVERLVNCNLQRKRKGQRQYSGTKPCSTSRLIGRSLPRR